MDSPRSTDREDQSSHADAQSTSRKALKKDAMPKKPVMKSSGPTKSKKDEPKATKPERKANAEKKKKKSGARKRNWQDVVFIDCTGLPTPYPLDVEPTVTTTSYHVMKLQKVEPSYETLANFVIRNYVPPVVPGQVYTDLYNVPRIIDQPYDPRFFPGFAMPPPQQVDPLEALLLRL